MRARILRFIPISSHGKRCMRVETCGHSKRQVFSIIYPKKVIHISHQRVIKIDI